jgi:hypothetical protein
LLGLVSSLAGLFRDLLNAQSSLVGVASADKCIAMLLFPLLVFFLAGWLRQGDPAQVLQIFGSWPALAELDSHNKAIVLLGLVSSLHPGEVEDLGRLARDMVCQDRLFSLHLDELEDLGHKANLADSWWER